MMESSDWIRGNLRMAWMHHSSRNYAVSVPLCLSLLENGAPPVEAAECHIMLSIARVPEAMDHIITANTILREAMDLNPENEPVQELYLLSQDILRAHQALEREARGGSGSNAGGSGSGRTISETDLEGFAPPEHVFAGSTPNSISHTASADRGRAGHRRRHSGDVETNLAPIVEEDHSQYPSNPVPAPRPRVRRLSSLSRAAKRIAETAREV